MTTSLHHPFLLPLPPAVPTAFQVRDGEHNGRVVPAVPAGPERRAEGLQPSRPRLRRDGSGPACVGHGRRFSRSGRGTGEKREPAQICRWAGLSVLPPGVWVEAAGRGLAPRFKEHTMRAGSRAQYAPVVCIPSPVSCFLFPDSSHAHTLLAGRQALPQRSHAPAHTARLRRHHPRRPDGVRQHPALHRGDGRE